MFYFCFQFLWNVINSLWYDFIGFLIYVQFQINYYWIQRMGHTVVRQFDRIVSRYGNKTAILYCGERISFSDIAHKSHQVSHWVDECLQLGLHDQSPLLCQLKRCALEKQANNNNNNNNNNNGGDDKPACFKPNTSSVNGDDDDDQDRNSGDDSKNGEIDDNSVEIDQPPKIGLMFGNIPEIVAFTIGIARCRAATVLFNVNNRRDSLLNALAAVPDCRTLVVARRYWPAIVEIADQLPDDIRIYCYHRSSQSLMINLANPDNNNNNNNNNYDLAEVKSADSAQNQDINVDSGSSEDENDLKNSKIDSNNHRLTGNNFRSYCGESKFDVMNRANFVTNFAPILEQYSAIPLEKQYGYQFSDHVAYIFTSGTTGGKSKATPVDNVRYIVAYLSQKQTFRVAPSDNIYISLPLYHAFGGILGVSYSVLGGATITLADKFSPSRFWSDCRANKCSIALYIGDTCRYLLAQPNNPDETEHSLRMMLGIALRKEIWSQFRKRFRIPRIAEFYGSSEGNINLFNIRNVEGSCGMLPYYFGPFTRFLYPIFLIKVDPQTLEPIRGNDGLCRFAYPGDIGLLVGHIKSRLSYTKFLGYTSASETEKKIIRDVCSRDDAAFSSGDLMTIDIFGNLFFHDRTGDTFRWKGENVSTTEVESIAAQFLSNQDCVVYGVRIAGTDGAAGMIAIKREEKSFKDRFDSISSESSSESLSLSLSDCEEDRRASFDENIDEDLNAFARFMSQRVPEYAAPKFVRLTNEIEKTSTHKLIKYRLREQGYDPAAIANTDPDDQIYYFDRTSKTYCVLDDDAFRRIQQGLIRF